MTVLVLALSSAPQFFGQRPASSENSLTQVANELRSDYGPVRFHREERFEDRLGILAPKSGPHYIYRIEGERFDYSGRTVIERVPSNLPTMYIATTGQSVYRLAGFPGAEQNFNKFVKAAHEDHVHGKQDAESRGLLCAEIVYGLSPEWWLDGPSSAKLKAAEHFFGKGSEDGLTLGSEWWKSAKGNRDALNITTTELNEIFLVSLPIFWAPVESDSSPAVKLYRINIAADGSCTMPDRPTVILQ
jgi:hypothetical protein